MSTKLPRMPIPGRRAIIAEFRSEARMLDTRAEELTAKAAALRDTADRLEVDIEDELRQARAFVPTCTCIWSRDENTEKRMTVDPNCPHHGANAR